MLSPRNTVFLARVGLFLTLSIVFTLMLGPFEGAEALFLLTDKEAHILALFALTIFAFMAAPRMRRNDLALALVALGACTEVAQAVVGRDGNTADFVANALGVFAAWAPAHAQVVRQRARSGRHTERRSGRHAPSSRRSRRSLLARRDVASAAEAHSS